MPKCTSCGAPISAQDLACAYCGGRGAALDPPPGRPVFRIGEVEIARTIELHEFRGQPCATFKVDRCGSLAFGKDSDIPQEYVFGCDTVEEAGRWVNLWVFHKVGLVATLPTLPRRVTVDADGQGVVVYEVRAGEDRYLASIGVGPSSQLKPAISVAQSLTDRLWRDVRSAIGSETLDTAHEWRARNSRSARWRTPMIGEGWLKAAASFRLGTSGT